jgi:dipeptidyl aminopeptidase/acylaminoacyl peptidase
MVFAFIQIKETLMLRILFFTLLILARCSHMGLQKYSGHGADSVSAKTLEKFAPKPIEPQKLNRIEAMLDVRSPAMGELSPDGQSLYFSWSVTGTNQIWKTSKVAPFPVQMTGGQDGTQLHSISPDGKLLILTRDEKGNEYPYLYIQSVKGGPLELIAGKKEVITNPQFVSDDSRYLYFTQNDKGPTLHTLYKIDLKTKQKTQVLTAIDGYMSVDDHNSQGDLLIGNAKGNIAREYYLYNEQSKKLTPIVGQNENEEYNIRFAPKRGEYIVQTNKLGEYRKLYLMKSGELKAITPEMKYSVDSFDIDKKHNRILFTINRNGYSEIQGISANTFKEVKIPFKKEKGVLQYGFGKTTPNSRYTVFSISKFDEPLMSYVYDWQTGTKHKWVTSSSPEINTTNFIEPSLESYEARDGTPIPMFVSRPKQCTKNKNCPVIVIFHGGPESQYTPNFSAENELYMEEGFIIVRPNVRGSDGYSKTWLNSDNGPKRLNVITDIEDASIYIKKNWAVNGISPKIGVMGGSYGGYSTNMAMTYFAGAYDAGVTVVGMSSLVTFLENTGPYRRHLRITEYGDPSKDLEALKKLSPVTYLDRIKAPILLIHGATDPRVPAGEAIQIYDAMKSKGLDGELILFADEGHGVKKRKNRAIYIGHTLSFFKKHLQ